MSLTSWKRQTFPDESQSNGWKWFVGPLYWIRSQPWRMQSIKFGRVEVIYNCIIDPLCDTSVLPLVNEESARSTFVAWRSLSFWQPKHMSDYLIIKSDNLIKWENEINILHGLILRHWKIKPKCGAWSAISKPEDQLHSTLF
jgi:hypothetical protein